MEDETKNRDVAKVENDLSFYFHIRDSIDLILYHKNCHDGIVAMLVAEKYLKEKGKEFEAVGCRYEEEPPICEGKNVLVVDFSFDLEKTKKMKSEARSFLLLDHHASAHDKLKDEGNCFFDMKRSGCMLAWNFFFPNLEPPEIVTRVQDKDLWKWEMEKNEEFVLSLEMVGFETSKVRSVFEAGDEEIKKMIEQGNAYVDYKRHLIETIASKNEIMVWDPFRDENSLKGGDMSRDGPYVVRLINPGVFVNEVGSHLIDLSDCDIAVLWSYNATRREYKFMLRSRRVDSSVVSVKFGGGGHTGASGFSWGGSMESFLDSTHMVPKDVYFKVFGQNKNYSHHEP